MMRKSLLPVFAWSEPEMLGRGRALCGMGRQAIRIICACSLLILMAPMVHAERDPVAARYLMLLDEDFSWIEKRGADLLVKRAVESGFTTIVPCVWHGRGVSWQSRQFPADAWKWPDRKGDPLAYLIKAAHAAGLEVHPWFTVVLRQRDFYPEFRKVGISSEAFNVHDPRFRKFITSVIMDVVNNYDIDGINLDYIRAMGVDISEASQEEYRRLTDGNLLLDAAVIGPEQLWNVGGEAWERIATWNTVAVDELLNEISTAVRARKPGILLSVSSHAGFDWMRVQGTNSVKWANAGLIDLILHMEYGRVGQMNRQRIDTALAALVDRSKFLMLAANYDARPGSKPAVQARPIDEVTAALSFGCEVNPEGRGVGLYSNQFLLRGHEAFLARTLDACADPGGVIQ